MAGIEPASERIDPRISTSVVGQLILPASGCPTGPETGDPLGPEEPLLCRTRQPAQHSGILSPDSTTGQSAGWADVVSEEAMRPAHRLGGEGHSSVRSVIGTCFLCGFYEFGTSRLAIRDQPLPSKPVIPGVFLLYLNLGGPAQANFGLFGNLRAQPPYPRSW
jgi:hypothetical protein